MPGPFELLILGVFGILLLGGLVIGLWLALRKRPNQGESPFLERPTVPPPPVSQLCEQCGQPLEQKTQSCPSCGQPSQQATS